MNEQFQRVYTASGRFNAESIKLLLESTGIQVMLAGESIGTSYGLGVGPLAEVDVLVPLAQVQAATEVLAALENGELELPEKGEDNAQEEE